jgi:hypothetical protein
MRVITRKDKRNIAGKVKYFNVRVTRSAGAAPAPDESPGDVTGDQGGTSPTR